MSSPAGATRPGARAISNAVSVQTTTDSNARTMSSYVYGWGQFLDHDIGLTTTGNEAFNIPVPTGDTSFDPFNTGVATIPLSRSNFDDTTGTTAPTVVTAVLKLTYKPAKKL